MVIATWCQREETSSKPLTEKDKADLQFLYDEWTHPHFVSKEEYSRLLEVHASVASACTKSFFHQFSQVPYMRVNRTYSLCPHEQEITRRDNTRSERGKYGFSRIVTPLVGALLVLSADIGLELQI